MGRLPAMMVAGMNRRASVVGGRIDLETMGVVVVALVWARGRTRDRGIEGHKYCPSSSLLFFSRGVVNPFGGGGEGGGHGVMQG